MRAFGATHLLCKQDVVGSTQRATRSVIRLGSTKNQCLRKRFFILREQRLTLLAIYWYQNSYEVLRLMLSEYDLIIRLACAAALGSAIGLERERLQWVAGLRTHMLVCVGSALIMMVSSFGFSEILQQPHVVLDPSRLAAQVVSGIGFLGAGTILLRGEVIKGLTTAASLWSVAAIGLAVGCGMYLGAIITTIIILVILIGIKPIEGYFRSHVGNKTIRVIADSKAVTIGHIYSAVGVSSAHVRQFVAQPAADGVTDEVDIVVVGLSSRAVADVMERLKSLAGVRSVSIS